MGHNGYLAAARECLAELRQGTKNGWSLVGKMRQYILDGGICLRDLGTSTKEIWVLVEEGAKIRALKLLRELREEGWDRAEFVSVIYESVAEAHCSLADIGTSEDELASFGDKPANLFE